MAGKKKSKLGWKGQLLVTVGAIAAIVFLPTTIILFVGMIPTLVAVLVDRTAEQVRGMTVGAMNLAGCMPFVMDLWTSGHTPERAVEIVFQPLPIVVMYSAAGFGYLVEWAMTGIVVTFLEQKAAHRLRSIAAQQESLIGRWGREVSGEMPLDPNGFPLEQESDREEEKGKGKEKEKGKEKS